MDNIKNFQCAETQILAVTSTSAVATFATREGQIARDMRIQNIGTVGAWLLPVSTSAGVVKNQAGGVAGTAAVYIMAGEDVVLRKPTWAELPYIAGITDSSTTTLVISTGTGS